MFYRTSRTTERELTQLRVVPSFLLLGMRKMAGDLGYGTQILEVQIKEFKCSLGHWLFQRVDLSAMNYFFF